MTRKEIIQLARFLLDELVTDRLADSSTTEFDMLQALQVSYDQYTIETECFEVSYTLAATADQHTYAYSLFGTGTPKTGARMFKVVAVAYDEKQLDETTKSNLAAIDPHWRFASSSTPRLWIPAGERKIRLWPTPPSTSNIDVEGYETPDPVFTTTASPAGDALVPDIHVGDHRLLAIGAAILPLLNNPNEDNQLRTSPLYQELVNGWKAARKRIHGSGRASIIVGRRGAMQTGGLFLTDPIIPAI